MAHYFPRPSTEPSTTVRCRACDNHVTVQFARVFGDNENVVHGCPACTTYRELQAGGGLVGP